jgi:hypothetical protein
MNYLGYTCLYTYSTFGLPIHTPYPMPNFFQYELPDLPPPKKNPAHTKYKTSERRRRRGELSE